MALAIKTKEIQTMNNLSKILVALLFCFSYTCISAEWYEGGALTDKNALTWQEATFSNKIATSSDFVATMYQNKMLISSISNTINSVNDLAPHAIQLAICIDEATAKNPDPEKNKNIYTNQQVSGMAVLCAMTMGWFQ